MRTLARPDEAARLGMAAGTMTFAPADASLMQTGTAVSMLAMAGLIGSRWCGRHGARVRVAVTILYIAAILALVGLDLFVQ